jgi:hypothetical protein
MSSRTGVLSDIEVNKHCAMHRPVPFNRLDLLIPNLKNVSGVYSRKLKELKVLSRPATAYEMIMELQRLNPKVDIMAKYEEMLQRPAPVLQPRQRPADDLSRETQPITQQYYERPNIADLAYMDLADLEGLLANIMEGTTWGGTERGGSRQNTPAPSAMAEENNMEAFLADAEGILAQDKLDLQEGLEASASMDAPSTPAPRMTADREARQEAFTDPAVAGMALTSGDTTLTRRGAYKRPVITPKRHGVNEFRFGGSSSTAQAEMA